MAAPVSVGEKTSEPIDRSMLIPGARLSGADLSGTDLSGLDLTGADLSLAVLSGCRATKACLRGANLHEAALDGAQFLHTDLTAADLSEVSAVGAGFGGCVLDQASLFAADLRNTSMSHASLRGSDLRMADLRGARMRAADLTGVDASQADLSDADLTEAVLGHAILNKTDLRGARLRGIVGYQNADWVGAKATGADFTGAYLARRVVIDQNYLHEFRSQNRMHEWIYRLWWVTSDCGRSYFRWAMWTLLVAAVFAGLYEVVDIDYGQGKTLLSSAYFSVVTLTTLGFGDVVPVSQTAQAVVIAQVVIGYVMLGGLLSIFSSKMSRRGD